LRITNSQLVNSLCFIIPAFILIIPASGEIAFAIVALYSFFYCYQQKINPFTHSPSKSISYIVVTYFCIALLSILASDISTYAFKRLGTNIHFLVAPWLIVLLSQHLNKNSLNYAIKTGASLAGIVACYQYFYLALRAHGTVNAIPFGDTALLLSFFSLINIHNETHKQKWVSIFSFILGCSAVILSLSRGAWVTIPFLFIALLFIWYKQKCISLNLIIAIFIIGVIGIGAASLTPQVQSRIHAVQQDIQIYEDNALTSVGTRIILWKTALKAIPAHPILGFGLHNTKQVTAKYVENQYLKTHLQGFGHFHNEYLTTLVAKGAVGLLSLLILLIAPPVLFFSYLSQPNNRYASSLILLLCIGYSFFGLTNLAFGHGIMNTFFIFILAASTSLINPTPIILNKNYFK